LPEPEGSRVVKPAVFLDRDGTLIESVHYLRDPDRVRLIPGAARALSEMRTLGYHRVVVTNQAAVGKGLLSLTELHCVQRRLEALLAAEGASIDAWYFCPEAAKGTDRLKVEHPDRKPGPGMLVRAARELDLVLDHSVMVGDAVSDTLAGRLAGCAATILIRGGASTAAEERHPSIDHVVSSLSDVPHLLQSMAK
jgi:D-glycero-D-manno-heptose 1,7-bisphosphate phosphatase